MEGLTEIKGSRIVTGVKYDEPKQELYVSFNNESVYKYSGVTPEEFEAMLAAESVGQYFVQNIKRSKNYERVE